MSRLSRLVWLVLLLGCSLDGSETSVPTSQRTVLKVAMFPYIPPGKDDAFDLLEDRIEREFERKNPDVDLVLRPLNANDDFYDPGAEGTLGTLLRQSPSGAGAHVVEIDAVLLGDLIRQSLIAPWPFQLKTRDYHPAALEAVRVDEVLYGVPHWLCGFFIVSRDGTVLRAQTAQELRTALQAGPSRTPNLVGDLAGSWDLPSLYLDAWSDSHDPAPLPYAIGAELDQRVVDQLGAVVRECEVGGANPCVAGKYDGNNLAPEEFARGTADALIGWSERLYYVFRTPGLSDPDEIGLASVPAGNGDRPAVFVDAWVLRKDECNERCLRAARRFVEYINHPETFEWVMMSEDNPGAPPRYLVPATRSAFRTSPVRRNRIYRAIQEELKDAQPLPRTGLLEHRRTMRAAIKRQLGYPE